MVYEFWFGALFSTVNHLGFTSLFLALMSKTGAGLHDVVTFSSVGAFTWVVGGLITDTVVEPIIEPLFPLQDAVYVVDIVNAPVF